MESPLSGRRQWQVATAIRDRVLAMRNTRLGELQLQVGTLASDLGELQHVRRLLAVCSERRWLAASHSLNDRAARLARLIPASCQGIERLAERREILVPTIRDVLAELHQAEEEFEELRYYPEEDVLAVVTDTIELEDVYLGEFEIQLRIEAIASSQFPRAYGVRALDPHPASRNDVVTHPHVNDDRLCAGDAQVAIEAALAQGRISDLFLLVRSVLTTYNPSSAYVQLDDWDGESCHDCGAGIGGDDTYYCTSCDEDFCSDCASYCDSCDETTCLTCLTACSVCDKRLCAGCITRCPDCGARLCPACLKESKCACHESEEEDDASDSHANTEVGSGAGAGTAP